MLCYKGIIHNTKYLIEVIHEIKSQSGENEEKEPLIHPCCLVGRHISDDSENIAEMRNSAAFFVIS